MNIGQFWAILWVVSLVVLIFCAAAGNAVIDKTPSGVLMGVATASFCVSMVACVWVAAGLHLHLGVN